VDRDVLIVVAGDGDDREDTIAERERPDAVWPLADGKRSLNRVVPMCHNGRLRAARELGIPGCVIAMRV
jgi:hypothetical protein